MAQTNTQNVAIPCVKQASIGHDNLINAAYHFVELSLTQAILSPEVDLALVEELATQLSHNECALDRAMFTAIHHAPLVTDAKGSDFLEVVDILLELGVSLPRSAAWTAYGAHLTSRNVNTRAQAMTRLVVRRGGKGIECLHRTAMSWPEHTKAHAAFLKSLR